MRAFQIISSAALFLPLLAMAGVGAKRLIHAFMVGGTHVAEDEAVIASWDALDWDAPEKRRAA